MQRFLPIPIFIALLLGGMSLVLGLTLFQTAQTAKAREHLVLLTEQDLAMQEVSQTLRQNLTDLQSAARQYASLGERKQLRTHDGMKERNPEMATLATPVHGQRRKMWK